MANVRTNTVVENPPKPGDFPVRLAILAFTSKRKNFFCALEKGVFGFNRRGKFCGHLKKPYEKRKEITSSCTRILSLSRTPQKEEKQRERSSRKLTLKICRPTFNSSLYINYFPHLIPAPAWLDTPRCCR